MDLQGPTQPQTLTSAHWPNLVNRSHAVLTTYSGAGRQACLNMESTLLVLFRLQHPTLLRQRYRPLRLPRLHCRLLHRSRWSWWPRATQQPGLVSAAQSPRDIRRFAVNVASGLRCRRWSRDRRYVYGRRRWCLRRGLSRRTHGRRLRRWMSRTRGRTSWTVFGPKH